MYQIQLEHKRFRQIMDEFMYLYMGQCGPHLIVHRHIWQIYVTDDGPPVLDDAVQYTEPSRNRAFPPIFQDFFCEKGGHELFFDTPSLRFVFRQFY